MSADPKRVLSLGAGVQSTTILLLVKEGELPPLDLAVFADTQWEPASVYRHLEWLKSVAPCPLHVLTEGNIREDALNSWVRQAPEGGKGRFASLPLRTLQENGNKGMIRRQCSREYKVDPIERFIRREVLKLRKGERAKINDEAPRHLLEQWIGFSTDEMKRVRMSRKPWVKMVHPLIDLGMSRQNCIDWCANHGYPEPPKSACIGCPYHDNPSWERMKREDPVSWEDAVDFDRKIRNIPGLDGGAYIHRSCRPLDEIDFRSDEERGQGLLFEDGGCDSGMCGV